MTDKEKTPSSPEESQTLSFPMITPKNFHLFEEEMLSDWRPYLTTEGELFLGERLAMLEVKALQVDQRLELHKSSTVNLHDRVLHLEKMCTDLCRKNNEAFHAICAIRQAHHKFIDETNKKLKQAGF